MPDLVETMLSSREIFRGRAFSVRADAVRLPNGKEGLREVVEHRGSVCVVAVEGDRVYFVHQYRYAAGETLLELPAGCVEADEDPAECARREIEEEIGRTAERITWLCEGYVSPGYSSELQRIYLAEGVSPKRAEADDDEFIDVVTMPWTEALRAVDRGEFRDNKTVAGLLAAARRLGIR